MFSKEEETREESTFPRKLKYGKIKKKKDFRKILSTGKRAYGGTLTVVYLPAKEPSMAVCVGKKYGKSVERNRIKRLLREAFRAQAEKVGSPYAFLLIPKVSETYSFEGFRKDIGGIFKREKLEDG